MTIDTPSDVVNTIEELHQLPVRSVVRSLTGSVYEREKSNGPMQWAVIGSEMLFPAAIIPLPASVLYAPDRKDAS